MNLVDKLSEKGVGIPEDGTKVKCKVFEDNTGASIIAKVPKIRPRTKDINIKFWLFIEHVKKENQYTIA